ncbi:hypothetical protein [Streptomyces sp. NPDC012888]|uniref:hypothetical protein n=1 Tax=Streptomyces sp. NPDC012888 TaxID=3364855 RepID=UPI003693CA2B
MAFGFAPTAHPSLAAAGGSASRHGRLLEPADWTAADVPLLRNPREMVSGLHSRHAPVPGVAVIAVLGPEDRLVASASFTQRTASADGWEYRNALLARLRRVLPHDLRRRTPVRTAILLYCREGDGRWTDEDGAWMWGLRDACTLHGLRCGAYITLTRDGWQVIGEGRGGRSPASDSRPLPLGDTAKDPVPLPLRTGGGATEMLRRTAAR